MNHKQWVLKIAHEKNPNKGVAQKQAPAEYNPDVRLRQPGE